MATAKSTPEPATTETREAVEIEAPTDMYGNKVDQHLDRFPEGSAARSGQATPPSGQGGASPHDGISYQDQFPPNPEPSESAKAWGEKVDAVGAVQAHSDQIAEDAKAGGTGNDGPNEGTGTATSDAPKDS